MAKKEENKNAREYVIPLREKCRVVPRYKKANKAVKTIKEFLARHMQIRDRDLKKIRLDTSINEFVWRRGIRKPPIKVKVKAFKEGDIVRATLLKMPKAMEQKKAREERRAKKLSEIYEAKKEESKTLKEKLQDKMEGTEQKETKTEEEVIEEKEKQESVVEVKELIEKERGKKSKIAKEAKQKKMAEPVKKIKATNRGR